MSVQYRLSGLASTAVVFYCHLGLQPHKTADPSPLRSVHQRATKCESSRRPSDQNAIKEHENMLGRVDNSVKPETQADLEKLLNTYQDVFFSYSEYDAQHNIDTAENKVLSGH